jgi:conjugative transposon TraM protein
VVNISIIYTIPFATLFFWSLGGGKAARAQAATAQVQGLNMKLPGAKVKNDSAENKLGFYEQAEADSLKFKQLRKDDPYYKADTGKTLIKKDSLKGFDTGSVPKGDNSMIGRSFSTKGLSTSRANLASNEQQINQKLNEINRQISQPSTPVQPTENAQSNSGNTAQLALMQAEIQRLGNANTPDPQMQQLSGMLDKIQEIQNPALVRQKLKAQSEKERGTVLPVSGTAAASDPSVMQGSIDTPNHPVINAPVQNGFYGLDQDNVNQSGNAVSAVVHETQTLTAGSTIKLRLLQDIFVNGVLIPKETFLFGTCSIEGERLTVDIKTIRFRNSVFPVAMQVFDQDGLSGIYVPGAISRDAAKEGTDQAIQTYNPMSYDPSLGAQAATAGLTMAKGFLGKKVKLVKVTVKAGYEVLLLNGNQLNK